MYGIICTNTVIQTMKKRTEWFPTREGKSRKKQQQLIFVIEMVFRIWCYDYVNQHEILMQVCGLH